MAFDHDKVTQDFHEWRRWLDRKSQNEETSWQGWWVMETEYMTRTPRSTKFWLTLFNLVIPILVIAACISSLEATSVSRVYFLMISVGGTVGLVLVGLFLVYQFHPVGDTFRWLKFFLGIIVLALLIVTIIFVIPTAVRLTHLGVVSVPKAIVEAGEAFGATKRQLLWKVELPSALPTIMAGLTQSIMLSLSMVVFAALIGAGGLGTEINRALGSRRIDLGLEAGLAIVVLAIVLDRMTRIGVGGKK